MVIEISRVSRVPSRMITSPPSIATQLMKAKESSSFSLHLDRDPITTVNMLDKKRIPSSTHTPIKSIFSRMHQTERVPGFSPPGNCPDSCENGSQLSSSQAIGGAVLSNEKNSRDVSVDSVKVLDSAGTMKASQTPELPHQEIGSICSVFNRRSSYEDARVSSAQSGSPNSSIPNSFAWRQSSCTGAGLENLGNTCFLNAVLQCFTHTVPLVQKLRSLNHASPCSGNHNGFCTLRALRDHVENALESPGGTISPEIFVQNLHYISTYLQKYEQEDAHEFLQCLVDRLETCFAGQSEQEQENSCPSEGDNFVKEMFGGRLQSQVKCCNCGHCSDTFEPLNDFSLEIEDADSLNDALQLFTQVERVGDAEPIFNCDNCKKKVVVEKKFTLDKVPTIATFHFKRFKTDDGSVQKISKFVLFPVELDLASFLKCTEDDKGKWKYNLYAVVVHEGQFSGFGHYVCYVCSTEHCWHQLDDDKVTSVSEEYVLAQQAYILFYAREEVPSFATAIKMRAPQMPLTKNAEGFSDKPIDERFTSKFHFSSSPTREFKTQAIKPVEQKASLSSSLMKTNINSLIIQANEELDDVFDSSPPITPPRSPSPDIISRTPSGWNQVDKPSKRVPVAGMDLSHSLEGMQGKALNRQLRGMHSSRRRGFMSCIGSSRKCLSESVLQEKKKRKVFPGESSSIANLDFSSPPSAYKFSA